jgi:hypothetical protein
MWNASEHTGRISSSVIPSEATASEVDPALNQTDQVPDDRVLQNIYVQPDKASSQDASEIQEKRPSHWSDDFKVQRATREREGAKVHLLGLNHADDEHDRASARYITDMVEKRGEVVVLLEQPGDEVNVEEHPIIKHLIAETLKNVGIKGWEDEEVIQEILLNKMQLNTLNKWQHEPPSNLEQLLEEQGYTSLDDAIEQTQARITELEIPERNKCLLDALDDAMENCPEAKAFIVFAGADHLTREAMPDSDLENYSYILMEAKHVQSPEESRQIYRAQWREAARLLPRDV